MENKYVEGGTFSNEIACQNHEKEEMFLHGKAFIQIKMNGPYQIAVINTID
jgi:hypothetical protein